MEPLISALLVAGSSKVFKALVDGNGLERAEIGELASAMFDVLIKVREQGETLSRIEAKLDRLLQQDFDRSYRLGVYLLRDAAHPELDAAAQGEALRSARTRFLEAAAGTSNGGQHAQALYAAAGCSLLAGRPDTARAELDDAWGEAFNTLKNAARRWKNHTTGPPETSLWKELRHGSGWTQNLRIQDEVESEVAPLRPIIEDIQKMRQTLGVPESKCAVPVFARNHIVFKEDQPWNFRPLYIRARCPDVILPDGSAVSISAEIDRPHQLSQFPRAPGAWVRATADVRWAADEEPVAAIYPAYERAESDGGAYQFVPTTITGMPKQNQQLENSWNRNDYKNHTLKFDAGCPTAEVLVVTFFDSWAAPWVCIGFTQKELGRSAVRPLTK